MQDIITYAILINQLQKLYEEKGLGEVIKKLQSTNYKTIEANNNKEALISIAKMNFYIVSELIGRCKIGKSKANLISLSDHIHEMANFLEEASKLV